MTGITPEQSKEYATRHDIFNSKEFVGIPEFTPTHTLHVKFAGNGGEQVCECGNQISIEDSTNPPWNIWWEGPEMQEDDMFTLVELDLDAPSKAKAWLLSPILHYLVVNINFPPNADTPWTGVLDRSVLVRPYLKPGPPQGTGLHRYIFVLCKQPRLYDIKEVDNMRKLGKMKINWPDLLQKYKLQPIAINFFTCQNPNQQCTLL